MKFTSPAKDVSVSSMVTRMKLTTTEKISGNKPISSSRKMAGEISQYLKLRSGWAVAAMTEAGCVPMPWDSKKKPLPPKGGRGAQACLHFRIGAGLGGPG